MSRLVLSLLVSALATGSARSVVAPAPVTALAYDGPRIAYASGRSAYDCDRVRVWNLATRGVTRLGRRTHCEQTSTGSGIATLAIAGTRVLWLHYTGGNIREWSLWTATTTKPLPLRLRRAAVDVDDPPPIVVGAGDGSRLGGLLPYAVGRSVVVLRSNGARRFSWTAPERVVALSALADEVAVAQEGGTVTLLDGAGRVSRTERYADEVDALRITGNGLLVQRGRTLELRGALMRTWTLPAGARLDDATGTDAFYVVRGIAHALPFADGSDRVLSRSSHVQAEGLRVVASLARRVATWAIRAA